MWCVQDPQKAIPRGTLLAILITGFTYLTFAILVGMVVLREATPFIPSCVNHTYPGLVFSSNDSVSSYCNDTFGLFSLRDPNQVNNSLSLVKFFERLCPKLSSGNVTDSEGRVFSCTRGLLNDYQVVSQVSVVPYIVTVGESLRVCVCVSVGESLRVCVCLWVSPSVCVSVGESLRVCVCLWVSPSVCVSVGESLRVCVCG